MIDTKDRVDIHKITIEEPEARPSGVSWLGERLTQQDWERFSGRLSDFRADDGLYRNAENYAALAFHMLYVFPGKKDMLGLDENFRETYGSSFENKGYNFRNHTQKILEYLSCLKTFFPNSYDQGLAKQHKSGFLSEAVNEWVEYGTLQQAVRYKILFGEFDFGSVFSNELKDSILEDLSEWPVDSDSGIFRVYTELAGQIRVIFPYYFNESSLPPNFWQRAERELNTIRNEKPVLRGRRRRSDPVLDLEDFAFNLQILSASKIKFGERGMELVFEKALGVDEVSALPEVRKF